MKRIVAFVLIVMLALPACVLADKGDHLGDMIVVNCKEWVSLRETASVNAKRLEKVPLGATVSDCTQVSRKFVYGSYNGRYGYILLEYLRPANAGSAAQPEAGTAAGTEEAEPSVPSAVLVDRPAATEAPAQGQPLPDTEGMSQAVSEEIVPDVASATESPRPEATFTPAPMATPVPETPTPAPVTEAPTEAAEGATLAAAEGSAEEEPAAAAAEAEDDGEATVPDAEAADPYEREVLPDGAETPVTERCYDSAMGFSLWYRPDLFLLDDASYEGDTPSLMLEAYQDDDYLPVYLEFLPWTAGEADVGDFLTDAPAQYFIENAGEIVSGETENGDAYSFRVGSLDTRLIYFYQITLQGASAQAVASVDESLDETYAPVLERIIRSVAPLTQEN
ncbi:MAG: hypothetical protein IJ240_09020 [Clostridia bacterium]|nr:hypothetical protein [Clostridia bacterium]